LIGDLNFDHVSAYFKYCSALRVYRKGKPFYVESLLLETVTDLSLSLVFPCKKCIILADFQSVDGRQASILTILHMQVLCLVLVIADPWCSCCSACPVLQRRKHFVGCQKATQIVLPPETNQ